MHFLLLDGFGRYRSGFISYRQKCVIMDEIRLTIPLVLSYKKVFLFFSFSFSLFFSSSFFYSCKLLCLLVILWCNKLWEIRVAVNPNIYKIRIIVICPGMRMYHGVCIRRNAEWHLLHNHPISQ